MIRTIDFKDLSAIVNIYNYYIANSHSTFELTAIDEDEKKRRVERDMNRYNLPWMVLEDEKQVIGYAYATQWKARIAYAKTAETSIYLHKDFGGKGYGKKLYRALLDKLKGDGYHAIIGGISLPNEASVVLHESLGFEAVGVFKEVGYKFDRWIDVGYWQLIFD